MLIVFRRSVRALEVLRLYRNWPAAVRCYYRLWSRPVVTYNLRNGARFAARGDDPETIAAINDTWLRKVYTPNGDEIQRGYTIVDIGAQVGSFSVFASTRAEGVKVYSYEPSKESFSFLTKNIELNGLENVKAFQLAVSGHGGTIKFYADKSRSTYNSSTVMHEGSCSAVSEVDSLTLEQALDNNGIERCDLLKMDCEGAEYEILFNSPPAVLGRVRNISLEYHSIPDHHVNDLRAYLATLGYDVQLTRRQSYCGPILYARRLA